MSVTGLQRLSVRHTAELHRAGIGTLKESTPMEEMRKLRVIGFIWDLLDALGFLSGIFTLITASS